MKKAYFHLMSALLASGMFACTTADKEPVAVTSSSLDMAKARSFIDSINAKFTEQVRNGDSVALASHYWPDAELLLSNSEPIKGKDIVAAWGSMISMGAKDFTFSTTDITLSGDLLVETGNYEIKTAENILIDKGKYVVVWKQQNGEWKLYRDIGNTSLPAPTK